VASEHDLKLCDRDSVATAIFRVSKNGTGELVLCAHHTNRFFRSPKSAGYEAEWLVFEDLKS
jgi:hypothetical protein